MHSDWIFKVRVTKCNYLFIISSTIKSQNCSLIFFYGFEIYTSKSLKLFYVYKRRGFEGQYMLQVTKMLLILIFLISGTSGSRNLINFKLTIFQIIEVCIVIYKKKLYSIFFEIFEILLTFFFRKMFVKRRHCHSLRWAWFNWKRKFWNTEEFHSWLPCAFCDRS